MFEPEYTDLGEIGWCAGMFVHGLREGNILEVDPEILEEEAAERGCSVVVVSVNVREEKVIEWCKDNKFKKSPMFMNYNHGDRKTFLYMKQVRKSVFNKYNGVW